MPTVPKDPIRLDHASRKRAHARRAPGQNLATRGGENRRTQKASVRPVPDPRLCPSPVILASLGKKKRRDALCPPRLDDFFSVDTPEVVGRTFCRQQIYLSCTTCESQGKTAPTRACPFLAHFLRSRPSTCGPVPRLGRAKAPRQASPPFSRSSWVARYDTCLRNPAWHCGVRWEARGDSASGSLLLAGRGEFATEGFFFASMRPSHCHDIGVHWGGW